MALIKKEIEPKRYDTWFAPIIPLKLENNILTIQVPSHFFYEYLEENFVDLLAATIRTVIGRDANLKYSVPFENSPNTKPESAIVLPGSKSNGIYNNKKKSIENPFDINKGQKLQIDSQLNPIYNFDNFVEGECNRLARSAGLAVAQNPGKTAFNPLVIYGDSGMGKTHLAQAIGLKTKELHDDKVVLYVSVKKFTTQFTQASIDHKQNDFLHFYQMIDVLIIDDIQELAGKEKTEQTFFHIFNHLHQSGKQLIITSDKAPKDLKGMENRLLSRFKWGLSDELQSPDYDTRVRILKQRAYKDGITLNNEVIEYIAGNITNNVRELEGAIVALLAQSMLLKQDITLDVTRNIIDKLVKNTKREISIDYIQKIVCEHFSLPLAVLQAKSRKREIVQARQIAMYFSKTLTNASLSTIGSQIGKKDHATVLHACKTVNNLMDTNKEFKSQVEEIDKKLRM